MIEIHCTLCFSRPKCIICQLCSKNCILSGHLNGLSVYFSPQNSRNQKQTGDYKQPQGFDDTILRSKFVTTNNVYWNKCNDESFEFNTQIATSFGGPLLLTTFLICCWSCNLVQNCMTDSCEILNEPTENTHLLRKGKYHCTADLLFDWFGFSKLIKIYVRTP